MPTEREYNAMSFGRQLDHRKTLAQFQATAKRTHLSQKRQTYTKALREFIALNDVTEYYTVFNAGDQCHDDSFEVWYKSETDTTPSTNKCNRKACGKPNAVFWNHSTQAWYCGPCASKINSHSPGLCVIPTPTTETVTTT